jgi:hypothetical protein
MKFKVLESNDYDYNEKDKNFYYSWDWARLRSNVGKNPKKMTFNPLESEFQKLYSYWARERFFLFADKVVLTLLLVAFGFLCFVLYSAIFLVKEGINV